MSDYIRPRIPGASIFFTVALAARGSRLLVEEIDRLRSTVAAVRAERPFRVEAWVVLPDHMHAIWTLPEGDADYSVRWSAIKARFTMSLRGTDRKSGLSPACLEGCLAPAPSKVPTELPMVAAGRYKGRKPDLRADKRETAIWQRRFWEHHIRNDRDLSAHLQYCWNDPVKHGLVGTPGDWPYSSVHREIRSGRFRHAP